MTSVAIGDLNTKGQVAVRARELLRVADYNGFADLVVRVNADSPALLEGIQPGHVAQALAGLGEKWGRREGEARHIGIISHTDDFILVYEIFKEKPEYRPALLQAASYTGSSFNYYDQKFYLGNRATSRILIGDEHFSKIFDVVQKDADVVDAFYSGLRKKIDTAVGSNSHRDLGKFVNGIEHFSFLADVLTVDDVKSYLDGEAEEDTILLLAKNSSLREGIEKKHIEALVRKAARQPNANEKYAEYGSAFEGDTRLLKLLVDSIAFSGSDTNAGSTCTPPPVATEVSTKPVFPKTDENSSMDFSGPARNFKEYECRHITRHWDKISAQRTIRDDEIIYTVSPSQTVSIRSNCITYKGYITDEVIKLSIEYARDNWQGIGTFDSKDQHTILRFLAFAKVAGVEITNHKVPEHAIAEFERLVENVKAKFPALDRSDFQLERSGAERPGQVRAPQRSHDAGRER